MSNDSHNDLIIWVNNLYYLTRDVNVKEVVPTDKERVVTVLASTVGDAILNFNDMIDRDSDFMKKPSSKVYSPMMITKMIYQLEGLKGEYAKSATKVPKVTDSINTMLDWLYDT